MSMPPKIFDRKLQQLRSIRLTEEAQFLRKEIRTRLDDRLLDIKRDFQNILNLDAPESITDDEQLNFAPNSFDLITSNLTLHTINDLPGVLAQIRQSLKPDGFFLATMLGGKTLYELRAALTEAELSMTGGASARVAPFADLQDMAGLLQRANLALPVADSETVTVSYPNITRLMHDLRGMGQSNILKQRSRKPLTRSVLEHAEKYYRAQFGETDGRLPATFEILYLAGWAPHESQQQPLKRGSGEISLEKALNHGT